MKKPFLITIIVLLIIIIGITWYFYYNLRVPAGSSNQNRAFEIIEDEGSIEIASNLKEKGFIKSPWFFVAYVKYKKVSLLPGIYYLRQNMTLNEIVEPISKGNVQEYKITIPEGWRITQIDEYLAKNKIIKSGEFSKAAKDKEGYLFPDTYRISIQSTAVDIIKKMEDNFNERTINNKLSKEQLIIASIVEREAKKDEDRAKIAGIYYSRLTINMKLEADPTVQYAKGDWELLASSDLWSVISPYNTYLNKGLPPTPICNPGLKSINAAINPEKSDYYYFFHLKDGLAVFSKTANEHQVNLEKYASQIAN
ncbi:hypothetical protein A3F08_02505 [Candidatus Berkelbacteria bacterium RIFCSPHIGHO2_12_FULL_36_9]|uniref:Endolytic murein transglycosylase n=1 Tax=Candidatus Berkelbacteria bacterium RIFCSPHIGHO2_12_FULL_36_9 TaxID=1797469 RepID=A0A1F5EFV3_9BACT|nr:MAG: hypothetical protein A3F08_02505 [Candidatus Berkelbacteria bacterium RIFCSPHIGHO2_12_FULL_36_9]